MAAEDGFLFGTDYPLYSIKEWKDGVFIVSGGGGKAKTGIKNKVVRKNTTILSHGH